MKFIYSILFSIFLSFSAVAADVSQIASKAEDVSPLLNGENIPDVTISDVQGNPVNLKQLISEKPSILIFYRGGWCPYCNAQLAGLKDIEKDFVELGYQIIAISPDSPERLKEQTLKSEFNLTLLSDYEFKATSEFGLGFFLDDKVANRYKDRMGITFADINGTDKVALPVPAVYMADSAGLIHFQYVNPNFRVRVEPELLLQSAKILALK